MALSQILFNEAAINEYGKKLVKQLKNKFRKQNPRIEDSQLDYYINRFEKIKQGLDKDKRDIMQYDFDELERTVDGYRNKKAKGARPSKDTEATDEVYNKNGIRIVQAKDKETCVKYGKGYSFCISRDDDSNMFGNYRKDKGGSTVYFIFNDRVNQENVFHLGVLHKYNDGTFLLTPSDNDHKKETEYNNFYEVKERFEEEWGKEFPDDIEDVLDVIPLGIKDYYEDIRIEGNKIIISKANLSDMGLTELPDVYAELNLN